MAADPGPAAEELASRRSLVASALQDGVLVVEAGGAEGIEVSRDSEYLIGLRCEGAILAIDAGHDPPRSILFLPASDPSWERWHGPRASPGAASQRATGVEETLPLAQFQQWMTQRLLPAGSLWRFSKERQLEPLWLEQVRRAGWKGKVHDASEVVHPLRQIKSDWEVQQLEAAIERTEIGLRAGAAAARAGGNECQVESAIEAQFRRLGSPAPGFPSIVGSGQNNCCLHWMKNDGPIDSGDLLLMDVGARCGPYTADITRTVPIDGKWTDRQREIYQVVWRAQQAGIAAVRVGATTRDVDAAARAVIREAGYSEYFPHGTSHHVGMDVHDVGPFRNFQEGMVVTVEPGIYIPEEGFGIRIEDMVVVTADGCRVLSAAIPKDPESLARWCEKPKLDRSSSASPHTESKTESETETETESETETEH